MGLVKQINMKNRIYHIYNDIINLKHSKSNLLKIGKESYKNIGIYNIGYITIIKIDDLYLLVNHANYILRQKLEINT